MMTSTEHRDGWGPAATAIRSEFDASQIKAALRAVELVEIARRLARIDLVPGHGLSLAEHSVLLSRELDASPQRVCIGLFWCVGRAIELPSRSARLTPIFGLGWEAAVLVAHRVALREAVARFGASIDRADEAEVSGIDARLRIREMRALGLEAGCAGGLELVAKSVTVEGWDAEVAATKFLDRAREIGVSDGSFGPARVGLATSAVA